MTSQQRQMIRNAYFCESPETLQSAIEQAERGKQFEKAAVLRQLKLEIQEEEGLYQ
jgi:hypothetical protein